MRKTVISAVLVLSIMTLGSAFADDEGRAVADPQAPFFECEQAKDMVVEVVSRIVYIGIGGRVEVSLNENPTTGYMWHVRDDQPGMVEIEADEFLTAEESVQQAVGSGGVHRFALRMNEQGMVKVIFEYYRDWESENIAGVFELTVNVVPDGKMSARIDYGEIQSLGMEAPELLGVADTDEQNTDLDEMVGTATTVIEVEAPEKRSFLERVINWLKSLFK